MRTDPLAPTGLRIALDNGAQPRSIAMVLAYESGMTLQEVGNVYGISRERVRQLIKPITTGRRPRGPKALPPTDKYRLRLEEMWACGMTGAAIARELGITKGSVGQLVNRGRKAGWTLPYRNKGSAAYQASLQSEEPEIREVSSLPTGTPGAPSPNSRPSVTSAGPAGSDPAVASQARPSSGVPVGGEDQSTEGRT